MEGNKTTTVNTIELSTIGEPIEEPRLKSTPTQVTCYVCHANVLTEVTYKDSFIYWLTCGGFFG